MGPRYRGDAMRLDIEPGEPAWRRFIRTAQVRLLFQRQATRLPRAVAFAASLTCVCAGTSAAARPAGAPPPPYSIQEDMITGIIDSVPAAYTVLVRDSRGFLDRVELHDGTIIEPEGLTLARGQTVSIRGFSRRDVFTANEIETAPWPAYRWPDWVAKYYPGWNRPTYLGPVNYSSH